MKGIGDECSNRFYQELIGLYWILFIENSKDSSLSLLGASRKRGKRRLQKSSQAARRPQGANPILLHSGHESKD